jgi:hypothetical protein
VQPPANPLASARRNRLTWTQAAWVALGLVYAAPLAWVGYNRLVEINYQQRVRFIEQHRLWEVDRHYAGKPQTWTRMAAWLLTDSQLMSRVKQKYGGLADQIEIDYRRDLVFARAEAILPLVAWWALPLTALYGLSRLIGVRRRPAPRKQAPASVLDPRYAPPGSEARSETSVTDDVEEKK